MIAALEVWSMPHKVQDVLRRLRGDTDGLRKYLRKVTALVRDDRIILVAQKMLTSYPGTRAKPSDADLQSLQDALGWIEN